MKGHTETFQTKFRCQTELLEPEEILVDVFGKVTSNKLIATVLERTRTISANIVAQSRTL